MTQRIKVVIRPKPLSKDCTFCLISEIKTFVNIDYHNNTISLAKPSEKQQNLLPKDNSVRAFAFTKIFNQNVTQQDIY